MKLQKHLCLEMKVRFYGMIQNPRGLGVNNNKFHVITFSATDKKFLCVKGMDLFVSLHN